MQYKAIEDPKRITSVRVLDFFEKENMPSYVQERRPRFVMADFFFTAKFNQEELGLVEVSKREVVDKLSFDEQYELKKLRYWEKHYCRYINEQEWESIAFNDSLFEDTAKMFWLSEHLAKGGTIEFPMSQAWNRYYKTWETVVGNSRIPALRYFSNSDSIDVIRFKTRFYQDDINWKLKFNSLEDIENYYNHPAVINYRPWGGSLIPGVHFFNREGYKVSKLEYHNKLVRYAKNNKGLGLDSKKTLYWNIRNILDGLTRIKDDEM